MGKPILQVAYFIEIGQLFYGSALYLLYWERLGALLKSYRKAA
jgi:hypothetical protein